MRIILKLILWELMVVTTIDGYNMSHRLSSGHSSVNRKTDPPEEFELKYYGKNKRERVVSLRKVIDSTVGSSLVPIFNIESENAEQNHYTLLNIVPVFYHGVNSQSAITYFPYTNRLHGVIDQKFSIDDLPLTDANNPKEVAKYIVKMSNRFSCKIKQSKSKTSDSTSTPGLSEDSRSDSRKTLYPEILLIVDSLIVPSKEREKYQARYVETLVYAYAYWNAVDMLFRQLKRTNIRISIVRIGVGETIDVTKKIVQHGSYYEDHTGIYFIMNKGLEGMENNYNPNDGIIHNFHDFTIWMTRATLTNFDGVHRRSIDFACRSKPTNCGRINRPGAYLIKSDQAIIMHDDKYSDYHIAARELAHLMGVTDDDDTVPHKSKWTNRFGISKKVSNGIMHSLVGRVENCLTWTSRSEEQFENYARSESSCCLLNYPHGAMGKPKHPPKLMTIQDQCKCYGMEVDSPVKYQSNFCREMFQCGLRKGYQRSLFPVYGTRCSEYDNAYCIGGSCLK